VDASSEENQDRTSTGSGSRSSTPTSAESEESDRVDDTPEDRLQFKLSRNTGSRKRLEFDGEVAPKKRAKSIGHIPAISPLDGNNVEIVDDWKFLIDLKKGYCYKFPKFSIY